MAVAEELAKMTVETLYKESKDTKLGITFFRRDPQDAASRDSALISRIGASGPAAGKLNVGERVMTVQGVPVEGPLHAARMLRESEGFMKIGKLPKRPDFDEKLEYYQQLEAEAARAAMAATLPGQQPQSTPRTDAPTPRGPGAGSSVPSQYASGLRPLNQPQQPQLSLNIGEGLQTTGAQLSARAQEVTQGIGDWFGQLSARAGTQVAKLGSGINNLAEAIPTQANKETKAARTIQKGYRAFAARGHFHEERGAVLMLQSAARRKKAQSVRKYKATLVTWAAIVIQENYRRHKLREKAKAAELAKAEATPKKGIGSRLVKSLSFSRRKKPPPKPVLPEDLTADDLISARGNNPTPLVSSAEPSPGTPVAPEQIIQTKKRSLSFTRRKKAAETAPAEGPKAVV